MFEDGDYKAALAIFEELEDYKDSSLMELKCKYLIAQNLCDIGDYEEAISLFEELGDYEYSQDKLKHCKYLLAEKYSSKKDYASAISILETISDYYQTKDLLNSCLYGLAGQLLKENKYDEAAAIYKKIGNDIATDCYEQLTAPCEYLCKYISRHSESSNYSFNFDRCVRIVNGANSYNYVGYNDQQLGVAATVYRTSFSFYDLDFFCIWNPERGGFEFTIDSYCEFTYHGYGSLEASGIIIPTNSLDYSMGNIEFDSYEYDEDVEQYYVEKYILEVFDNSMDCLIDIQDQSNMILSWGKFAMLAFSKD